MISRVAHVVLTGTLNSTRSHNPTNIFTRCRVGLPAARVGIMEAMVAACLHPSALQWASGSIQGARHRGDQPPLATQWH